jgi:hypothetical protein
MSCPENIKNPIRIIHSYNKNYPVSSMKTGNGSERISVVLLIDHSLHRINHICRKHGCMAYHIDNCFGWLYYFRAFLL